MGISQYYDTLWYAEIIRIQIRPVFFFIKHVLIERQLKARLVAECPNSVIQRTSRDPVSEKPQENRIKKKNLEKNLEFAMSEAHRQQNDHPCMRWYFLLLKGRI